MFTWRVIIAFVLGVLLSGTVMGLFGRARSAVGG